MKFNNEFFEQQLEKIIYKLEDALQKNDVNTYYQWLKCYQEIFELNMLYYMPDEN